MNDKEMLSAQIVNIKEKYGISDEIIANIANQLYGKDVLTHQTISDYRNKRRTPTGERLEAIKSFITAYDREPTATLFDLAETTKKVLDDFGEDPVLTLKDVNPPLIPTNNNTVGVDAEAMKIINDVSSRSGLKKKDLVSQMIKFANAHILWIAEDDNNGAE